MNDSLEVCGLFLLSSLRRLFVNKPVFFESMVCIYATSMRSYNLCLSRQQNQIRSSVIFSWKPHSCTYWFETRTNQNITDNISAYKSGPNWNLAFCNNLKLQFEEIHASYIILTIPLRRRYVPCIITNIPCLFQRLQSGIACQRSR